VGGEVTRVEAGRAFRLTYSNASISATPAFPIPRAARRRRLSQRRGKRRDWSF